MVQTILVIDDDHRNIKLVRALLQVSGYRTLEATSGEQGIKLVRDEKPDLVLMDIQMPVMDGLEATRTLKADPMANGVPIVALTSYVMKGDEERIRAAGCDGYIAKPIDTREFLKKIREYLSR